MNVIVRKEQESDFPCVFALIESAFATMEESDHREHFLVERIRRSGGFVPELSLVAEQSRMTVLK